MSDGAVLKLAEARLMVISGAQPGLSLSLTTPRLIIGREVDCGLRLVDQLCSRHHAVLLSDDYTVRIRDLGSRNGTYVNGQRIESTIVLNEYDQIRVGTTVMVIRRCQPDEMTQVSEQPTEVTAKDQTRIVF